MLSFCMGLLQIIGVPSFYLNFIIALLTVIAFKQSIEPKNNSIKVPYPLLYLVYLLFISNCLTIIINENYSELTLKYLINFWIPFLFFFSVYNLQKIKRNNLLKIDSFIYKLFLLQIFASIVKFVLTGQRENYIGTISITNGALSTIVPLMAITFLFADYLYNKRIKSIILIFGFLFMAWVGGKRAIWYVLPIFISIEFFFYYRLQKKRFIDFKYLFQNIAIIIPVFIIISFAVRFMPSLNPEGVYSGSFDSEHMYNYAIN